MAESTLSGAYSDFRSEIADFLGYGRTSSNWSTEVVATIESILKSGLRKFYHPPRIGQGISHHWSFLHPVSELDIGSTTATVVGVPSYGGTTSTVTISAAGFESRMVGTDIEFATSEVSYTIASYTSTTEVEVTGDASGEASGDTITIGAQYIYDLPDNYGGIEGGFTYSDNNIYDTIQVVSDVQIRELQQGAPSNGYPRYCAIRPKSSDGTSGQRFEVLFYPTPSSTHTLTYTYVPLMDNLSDSAPYPWGGEPHTETVLESCLAVAELRKDDNIGEHKSAFMECLQTSIDYDGTANSPEFLGYNGDKSVYRNHSKRRYRGNKTQGYLS